MNTLRIILTLLTLTAQAHARDDGAVTPRPDTAPHHQSPA
jgi:hypothetical protein